jgi:transcriptional regulator with XRE-family HTH domain
VNPTNIALQLGKVIRELRLEAGYSQVEFAERAGIYQTYISRVENGRANPSLNALIVVANTLGVTVFELFELTRKQVQAS